MSEHVPRLGLLAVAIDAADPGHLDVVAAALAAAGDQALLLSIAGAESPPLADLPAPGEAAAELARLADVHRLLRRLETAGRPVAALLSGPLRGEALELALACHYRVAEAGASFGLPQVAGGTLPSRGGSQRLPRLVGMRAALPVLTEASVLGAEEARRIGLVDALAPSGQGGEPVAQWLAHIGAAAPRQPWDEGRRGIPGGGPETPAGMQTFMLANAALRARSFGNDLAAREVLSCMYEGLATDLDTGLAIEARRATRVAMSPDARNLRRLEYRARQYSGHGQSRDVASAGSARHAMAMAMARAAGRQPGRAPWLPPAEWVPAAFLAALADIIVAYLGEAMQLLAEGVSAPLVEKAARLGGMAMGPFELADLVPLAVIAEAGAGSAWPELGMAVHKLLRAGRTGADAGSGFYDYADGKRLRLWPELSGAVAYSAEPMRGDDVIERLITVQSLAAWQARNGTGAADASDLDLAAVAALGYPAFRGGPLGWIRTLGADAFVATCLRLASCCGPRFRPPPDLPGSA